MNRDEAINHLVSIVPFSQLKSKYFQRETLANSVTGKTQGWRVCDCGAKDGHPMYYGSVYIDSRVGYFAAQYSTFLLFYIWQKISSGVLAPNDADCASYGSYQFHLFCAGHINVG